MGKAFEGEGRYTAEKVKNRRGNEKEPKEETLKEQERKEGQLITKASTA